MARWAVAFHRRLLRAYPRGFRDRYGADLQRVFEARIAASSALGRSRRWLAAIVGLADLLWSGLAERFAPSPATLGSTTRTPGRLTMMLDGFRSDLRFALRTMRRTPAFTAVTMLVLALGIGSNGVIFAAVDNVLLRPLPYGAPDALVMIWSHNTNNGVVQNPVSPADFKDFRARNQTFTSIEAMQSFLTPTQFSDAGATDVVQTATISTGMFDVLGRDPFRGRWLRDGDTQAVVLSYGYWQRRYGGDESVVGRTLHGPAGNVTIVGITPRDFIFPYRSMLGSSGFVRAQSADIYVPMVWAGGFYLNTDGSAVRQARFLGLVGRLRPGVTLDQARADLRTLAASLATENPSVDNGWDATAVSLLDQAVGTSRPALLLLFAGVGVVLLMACVNVANLLFARSVLRQREMAVRAALGASRARLAQQAIVESVLLAIGGGLVGSLFLYGGVRGLVALAPADTPRLADITPNATVFGFTVLVAIVVGLVIGLLPATAASRVDLQATMKDGARGSTSGVARRRLRSRLIVGELALAVLLTSGATLLLRSFLSVLHVDPGFQPDQMLTFQINAPSHLTSQQAVLDFYDTLFTHIDRLPGVVASGGTTRLPLGSTNVSTLLQIEGRDVPVAQLPEVELRRAVHNYFGAMAIPIMRGRGFTNDDTLASPRVIIINRALEERLFPGEDPIGRRIRTGTSTTGTWLTIVGVVGSVRHGSLEEPPRPEVYVSASQNPPVNPFIAVRTAGAPMSLAQAIRDEIRAVDPTTPVYDVRAMTDIRSDSLAERRFILLLVGGFGVVALVLAAVGVFGVMALLVSERTAEVGVRLALGARPAQVLALMLKQAATLGVTGAAIGAAAALLVLPYMASLLYGVTSFDPITLAAVAITLMAITCLAAYVPARRAMRIDPSTALRSE